MTLEQLEFVCETASAGTIILAAQNCNVSHTTISRAIANLETELGFVIFDRSRRGCVLTARGAEVVRLSREMLERQRQLLQLGRQEESNSLHIGAYPIATKSLFQAAVAEFSRQCPETEITVDHAGVEDIVTAVNAHELDFGLICFLPELMDRISPSVKVTELMESNLVAVCSPASPLARKTVVTPEDLRRETFILQNEEQVSYMMKHVFFPDAMPRVAMRSNNNDLIKSTVASSSMVATYVEMVIADDPMVRSGQLCYRPIQVGDSLYRLKYFYIRPQRKPVSAAERTFIRILRKAAK